MMNMKWIAGICLAQRSVPELQELLTLRGFFYLVMLLKTKQLLRATEASREVCGVSVFVTGL